MTSSNTRENLPMTQDNSEDDIFSELDEQNEHNASVDADEVLRQFGQPGVADRHQAGTVECDGCGAGWIHQFKVEVFFRSEDSSSGVHVEAAETGASFDPDMDGCPSARRSGLSIWFWCEQCDAATRMDIIQHKGETFINTEVDGSITHEEVRSL